MLIHRYCFAGALCVLIVSPGLASSGASRRMIDRELMKLAPETRIEQRCDGRANGVVSREHRDMHPDKVVAYAFGHLSVKGTQVHAPGAAIRSRGTWYRLSYSCRTSPDGLNVESFEYTLGDAVPREDWASHNLFP